MVCLVSAGNASAAGFALIEQSASGIGNAFAGSAASAEDASTIFFNPAGMSYLPGKQIMVGVHCSRCRPSISTMPGSTTLNGAQAVDRGQWRGRGQRWVRAEFVRVSEPSPTMWLRPWHQCAVWAEDRIRSRLGGPIPGFESDLKTININASMAFKVNDKFSLGIGLNAQRASTLSQAVDFGTICFGQLGSPTCSFLGLTPQNNDGSQELNASDWGYGYNLGAIFQISSDMRIGVTYRSRSTTR